MMQSMPIDNDIITQETQGNAKKIPSAFDVARRAGVSQTTVSFVLSPHRRGKVAQATVKRVLDAVAELGYRPNKLARSLAYGRSQTVGLTLPYLDSDFHAKIAYGIRETLLMHDYHLLIMNAAPGADAEGRIIDQLLQQRVDAIACFVNATTHSIAPAWIENLAAARVPAIVIDSPVFAGSIDAVVSDDDDGMRSAVEHLASLGHRKICYIADDSPDDILPVRTRAFVEHCKRLGLECGRRITFPVYERQSDSSGVILAMIEALRSPDPPTAFIGFNDLVLEDYLKSKDASLPEVPTEVSLVGYSDSFLARYSGLTSVSQDPYRMGVVAAERLLERLENPEMPPELIKTSTSLIVRQTTAPPPAVRAATT